MQKHKLGMSGLQVSETGLGCASMNGVYARRIVLTGYAHVGLVNPGKRVWRTIEEEGKQMTAPQPGVDASRTQPPLDVADH